MTEYNQYYNLSEAAELYGVSKSVISRAINKTDGTGLSIAKQEGQEKFIAFVELMRVWGNPEEYKQKKQAKKTRKSARTGGTQPLEHSGTPEKPSQTHGMAQVAVLQSELQHTKELLKKEQEERQREREQMKEQQQQALEQVEKWQSQAEAQTRLLTDERESANKSLWQKLFGGKK